MRDKPIENNILLKKSWIENARAWTDAVRQGRILSRREGTDAAILNALLRFPASRVLDLGCGEGWLARQMSQRGYGVTGIDASAPLIEQAQQAGGGPFVCLSYEQFIAEPLLLGRFEVAVANFSLLSEELGGLLGALKGALVPGGSLLIQTLHPCSIGPDEPYRSHGALKPSRAWDRSLSPLCPTSSEPSAAGSRILVWRAFSWCGSRSP